MALSAYAADNNGSLPESPASLLDVIYEPNASLQPLIDAGYEESKDDSL
jgi:hypothetical protein